MNETTALQELITIESVPAKLDANFEQVRQALAEELSKYDFIVTVDGVADAKKAATEINRLKKAISDLCKGAMAEHREPIERFDRQRKELEAACEEARQGILGQVRAYEDRVREKCADALEAHRAKEWERRAVPVEHRRAVYDDLAQVSNLTGKGNLTKAAKEALDARIEADKNRADMVSIRLARLEGRCYEEGLSAPLVREHVERFLEADEEEYEHHLARLIDVELRREHEAAERRRQAEERERQRREREAEEQARLEARRREEAERRASETEGRPPDVPPHAPSPGARRPGPPAAQQGEEKVVCRVMASFSIRILPHVTDDEIRGETRRVFEEAGISTLDPDSIRIDRLER